MLCQQTLPGLKLEDQEDLRNEDSLEDHLQEAKAKIRYSWHLGARWSYLFLRTTQFLPSALLGKLQCSQRLHKIHGFKAEK